MDARACADRVGARERLEMGGEKDGGMSERGCADMCGPESQKARKKESQKGRKPKSQKASKKASQEARKPESQKERKPERQKAKKPESQ